jgi:hypothetical protein
VRAAADALDERLAGAAGDLYDVTLGLARDGNETALRMLLDRVWPVRRHRPLEMAAPAIPRTHDLLPAMASVANAMFAGETTPEEGAAPARGCSRRIARRSRSSITRFGSRSSRSNGARKSEQKRFSCAFRSLFSAFLRAAERRKGPNSSPFALFDVGERFENREKREKRRRYVRGRPPAAA